MMVEHQKQWRLLTAMAEAGKVPHALLFSGPSPIDKKGVAVEFVKFLNCRACNACQMCRAIDKGIYPDLKIINSQSQEIQIKDIRELKHNFSLKTSLNGYKIAVIYNAHLMNQEAQSAFLKLLEEPKGQSIFFLITDFPKILLPTILSRVQEIKFFSQNSKPETAQAIQDLMNSNLSIRFNHAKELGSDPRTVRETLEAWLRHFRSLLLTNNLPKNYSVPKLISIVRKIQTIYLLSFKSNINLRLALETLILEI